jgi:hypothetical protein
MGFYNSAIIAYATYRKPELNRFKSKFIFKYQLAIFNLFHLYKPVIAMMPFFSEIDWDFC